MPSAKRMTKNPRKLKEVKRILSQIKNGSSGSMDAFKQLEEYYNANISFNEASREEAKKAEIAGDPTTLVAMP